MKFFYCKIKKSWIMAVLFLLFGSLLFATQSIKLDEQKIIKALTTNYGERAALRGKTWLNIIEKNQNESELNKLNTVNSFFNMFFFIDDIKLWGDKNYWATPLEFIGANGGDCEDFAIAKYFTLLELGVDDNKMRISMVKAIKLNQYHMVVLYYKTPSSIPLVLDNLDFQIKPANLRTDLLPIYSFNGKQLWLNKKKGQGVLAGNSTRLKRWNQLNQRMGVLKLRQPKLKME